MTKPTDNSDEMPSIRSCSVLEYPCMHPQVHRAYRSVITIIITSTILVISRILHREHREHCDQQRNTSLDDEDLSLISD